MKIRTVTVGVSLAAGPLESCRAPLQAAAEFAAGAKAAYEAAGYEVQTVRVVTNPFEEYLPEDEQEAFLVGLGAMAEELGLAFFNIGPATTLAGVRLLPGVLRAAGNVSCSALLALATPSVGDVAFATAVAETALTLARESEGGFSSFRFGASTCKPGTPFFPAGYHASGAATSFAVGLENGDVACAAFAGCADVPAAAEALQRALTAALGPVERIALELEAGAQGRVAYAGIDTSLCPSLSRDESLVTAFEALGAPATFGGPGTLAVCAAITAQLQSVPVRRVGYCGLMLPPLEDAGLAERGVQGTYTVRDLLLFSSVCGIGLDCVPISGEESAAAVAALVMDVAALSAKWDKQLSCRLFPVPGKAVGEMTEFSANPYLCDTRVMGL